MVSDEVIAVRAAHRLGMPLSDRWPLVASFLLAAGVEGESVTALASLSSDVSGWEVDQLVPGLIEEIGGPELDDVVAAEVYARLVAHRSKSLGDHIIIRRLAALSPGLDYPGGVVGRAYALEEWLDCTCHEGSSERAEAGEFESELRALPSLQIPVVMIDALTD